MAFVALTANRYAVPLVSPVTVAVVWVPLTDVDGRAVELSPVV
jgi:hypothetical protein